MRNVRVDGRDAVAVIGDLAERFEQVWSSAEGLSDVVFQNMIQRFVQREKVRIMLISCDERYAEFSNRRTTELWNKLKNSIDLDCLPTEGPIGVLAQLTTLARRIDELIQVEWDELDEEEDRQV